MIATVTKRLRHFSHIKARETFLSAEAPAYLDIGAEEIPGETAPVLSDGEFEELMQAHTDGLIELPVLDDEVSVLEVSAPEVSDEVLEDEVSEEVLTFEERVEAVSEEQRRAMAFDIAGRIDDRLDRAPEIAIKNLNRARKAMVTGRVALALCAAGREDAGFVNREWMEGKEFNVYALLKLADIAQGLTGGTIGNAVNIAVIASMFALQAAGIPYDFDTAKAAASSEHTPQRPGVRKHLTRHTVGKGTASTQAGSTMHALMALGVVHFAPSKNPTYTILDNATTDRLRQAIADAEVSEEA